MTVKLLAFDGSGRADSLNGKILDRVIEQAKAHGAEITRINLHDFNLPLYDLADEISDGLPESVLKLKALFNTHDGFLIASPEHNGTMTALLKNAIDWASRASEEFAQIEVFKGKTAAIMTASPGAFGGIRCLNHLRGVLTIMLVHVLPAEIAVSFVKDKFDGDSEQMTDEKMKQILENLGASLADSIKKMRGEIAAQTN